MKIHHYRSDTERRVLVALITSKPVLARVASVYQKGMLPSKWADLIASWCVQHHSLYGEAPNRAITGYMARWAADRGGRSEEEIKPVEAFLTRLNEEYECTDEMNTGYLIDCAGKLFSLTRARQAVALMEQAVEDGDLDAYEKARSEQAKVELGQDSLCDVFGDKSALQEVFDSPQESIVRFPSSLGRFFGDSLSRDAFVSFLAPEKRGKCVAEDTPVVLADGRLRTIKEVVESSDSNVLSLDERVGRFVAGTASQFWDSGEKVCHELITKSGRKIVASADHQFLTVFGWKRLADIECGGFIAVPKRLNFFGDGEPSEDLVKFLAYMAADGCCVATQPSFTKTDPEMVADFHATCASLGIGTRRKGIATYLRGGAPTLRAHGMWRKKSTQKTVPECVMTAKKPLVAVFLRIFFSCDGSIYEDRGRKKIEVTLANEVLIRQIAHLLTRFGVVSSVFYSPVHRDGREFPAWKLCIGSEEYINLFLREINFISYKKTPPSDSEVNRSFLDRLPHEVVKAVYRNVRDRSRGELKRVFGGKLGHVREQIRLRQPMMRQSFIGVKDPEVLSMLNSEILWDEVVSIRCVGSKKTYDIGVNCTHNFVAADLVVHNSFMIQEVCIRALQQRRRVLVFQCGDMTQPQVIRRMACRMARRPFKARKILYPVELYREDKAIKVEHEERTWDEPMTFEEVHEAFGKVKTRYTRSEKPYFQLHCSPAKTMTVERMCGVIDRLIESGFQPDVVAVDYADILTTPKHYKESRDAVNHVWTALRGLSQTYHCLLVTATQANADSYTKQSLGMQNFSEDKRKLAHATAVVGLNQSATEKKQGLMRLNYIVLREDEFVSTTHCHVAGCLAVANPCVKSLL